MSFPLPHFTPPDFSLPRFSQAPDAVLVPSPQDKVAPEQYHATTISVSYTHLDVYKRQPPRCSCKKALACMTAWPVPSRSFCSTQAKRGIAART